MIAIDEFRNSPPAFWAYVRSISEWVGYTQRSGKGRKGSKIKVPTADEVLECLRALQLDATPLFSADGATTSLGSRLMAYFAVRAEVLNRDVEPALMEAREAAALFKATRRALRSKLPVAMNKQRGKKKKPAYLTNLVGMLIDAHRQAFPCDFDPRVLTAFTKRGVPVRTLSRRIDGAFPAAINPVAVWEIKEYYHTRTFGSRVADGVYETQLDGMELKEMSDHEGLSVRHYLFLDAHYTWWTCGKSYLCRIFDMVNMGLVDEVIVGRDVLTRAPALVREWIAIMSAREPAVDQPKAPLVVGKAEAE